MRNDYNCSSNHKRIIVLIIAIIVVFVVGLFALHHQKQINSQAEEAKSTQVSKSSKNIKMSASSNSEKKNEDNNTIKPTPSYINYRGQRVVDWYKPTGAHPDLKNIPANQLKLVVHKANQTLSVYDNNKLVSQMLVSTGVATNNDDTTPSGHWTIQKEHGKWFYNPKAGVQEGAWNWISFKDHGVYLFHSVPCDKNQKPVADKMGKLGHKNSHGCVQMSFPDNQWLYDNFANKVGTQVIIK